MQENHIIAMGSACGVTARRLTTERQAKSLAWLEVHLFRPFAPEKLLSVIPPTVRRIAVLDRTKEPGAMGEPLYLDIRNVYAGQKDAPLIGGREVRPWI